MNLTETTIKNFFGRIRSCTVKASAALLLLPGCMTEVTEDSFRQTDFRNAVSFNISETCPGTRTDYDCPDHVSRTTIGMTGDRQLVLTRTSTQISAPILTKEALSGPPEDFFVSVVSGNPGEDESIYENILFTETSGIYSGGLSWPENNPQWRFYASTAEMTGTAGGALVDVDGYAEDVVCAYNGSAAYAQLNNLEFSHILSQIGTVSVSTDTDAALEDVSITFSPVTEGTYNIYTGTWTRRGTAGTVELAPAAGSLTASPELFFLPGDYAVTVSWKSRIGSHYRERTTTTEAFTFEAGKRYSLSLELAGISVNFRGTATAPFVVKVLNADGSVDRTVTVEAGGEGAENEPVYELNNYDCDGTSVTAINTGVRLFDGSFPDGFRVEMEMQVSGDALTKNARSTYITGMCEAASPWQGFVWRHNTTANAKYEFKINPTVGSKVGTLEGTNILEFTYSPGMARAVINGEVFSGSVTIPEHDYPVCIGGSLSTTQTKWYADRYAEFHIVSLKIYSLTVTGSDDVFHAWLPDLEAGQRYSFEDCTGIKTVTQLPVNLRDGSGTLEGLFSGCSGLESVCGFNVTGVTSLRSCFEGCSKLAACPVLTSSSVMDFGRMFCDCVSLAAVPSLDTSAGTDFEKMFCNTVLTSAPVLDYSKGVNFQYMFEACRQLQSVPDLTLGSSAVNPGYMCGIFRSCTALETVGTVSTPGAMRSTLLRNGTTVSDGTDFFYYSSAYGATNSTSYTSLVSFGGLSGFDDGLDLSRCPSLTRRSIRSVFTALATAGTKVPEGSVSSSATRHRVTIHKTVWHRILTRDVQIALDKGWEVYVPGVGPTIVGGAFEGLEIDDYVCDGTAATALDTGVRLFSDELPDGFRLSVDMEVAEDDLSTSAQSTWISCKAENTTGWPGFSWRHILSSAKTMELTYRPVFSTSFSKPLGTSNHLEITYDGTSSTVVLNGETKTSDIPVPQHDFPLTIGGTYSEIGTWIEDRFGKCIIIHLEVYPLGDFED